MSPRQSKDHFKDLHEVDMRRERTRTYRTKLLFKIPLAALHQSAVSLFLFLFLLLLYLSYPYSRIFLTPLFLFSDRIDDGFLFYLFPCIALLLQQFLFSSLRR
jgi:hypothetical protein